jgi:hypothetical protein
MNGFEIHVDNSVGLRQKARGLRRSFGAQEDGNGQCGQDRGDNPERSTRASIHGTPSEIPYHRSLDISLATGGQVESSVKNLRGNATLPQVETGKRDLRKMWVKVAFLGVKTAFLGPKWGQKQGLAVTDW